MRIFFLSFIFLGFLVASAQASITERVIYIGNTPLASTCTVSQTGPMELTVAPCSFTTTGQAKVFGVIQSLSARSGVGQLAAALSEGKAEWLPGGLLVRAWLRDKQGNIIERSKKHILVVPSVFIVPTGDTYFIYLLEKAGLVLEAVLLPVSDPRPVNYVHYLAFEFTVPVGTTDLSNIEIEVFTVKPGFPMPKGLFQK